MNARLIFSLLLIGGCISIPMKLSADKVTFSCPDLKLDDYSYVDSKEWYTKHDRSMYRIFVNKDSHPTLEIDTIEGKEPFNWRGYEEQRSSAITSSSRLTRIQPPKPMLRRSINFDVPACEYELEFTSSEGKKYTFTHEIKIGYRYCELEKGVFTCEVKQSR